MDFIIAKNKRRVKDFSIVDGVIVSRNHGSFNDRNFCFDKMTGTFFEHNWKTLKSCLISNGYSIINK